MKIKVPTEEITDNFYTIIIYLSIKLSIEGDTTEESSDEVDTTADKSDVNESDGVNEKTEVKYINCRPKKENQNHFLKKVFEQKVFSNFLTYLLQAALKINYVTTPT